ncbi:hypothetical protein BKA66DRAFT_548069 [Pyrenochaeta sp. MPI-SDFR-AT-0127]|nr:hypothetical protein BKA66DRAFT_548069 [Pyrenochaeta sp. MPI-SDFR-AT-0127]
MKFTYVKLLPLLSLCPFTVAASTCTSSGSLPWPPVGDCSKTPKYDTAVQSCRACCMNDAVCFQACLKAAGLGKRDAIGEQFRSAIQTERGLSSRAIELSCGTNENCYKFTDGSLLCLNLGTGLYHDDVGGNGDYYSGKYTGPDGKVQTGTSVATASQAKSTSTTSQMTRSTAPVQTESSRAASASASSAAAIALSPLGGDGLYIGANVGLVGFVAGLVL